MPGNDRSSVARLGLWERSPSWSAERLLGSLHFGQEDELDAMFDGT